MNAALHRTATNGAISHAAISPVNIRTGMLPLNAYRWAHKRRLSYADVLRWADAYRSRHGVFPCCNSGRVWEDRSENWRAINEAMMYGFRGFPRGKSLADLLQERRGHRHGKKLPPLRFGQILEWADHHFERLGEWPHPPSGAVMDQPGETWAGISAALGAGLRGLPGGTTLAKLLAAQRNVRFRIQQKPLTIKQILAWADAHHRRTGRWPHAKSGSVVGAAGEIWYSIDKALIKGLRGLKPGQSLCDLLENHRGRRNIMRLPRLSEKQILAWADAFYARHHHWPRLYSGRIPGTGGETWANVGACLCAGRRGLPGGSSLTRLLARHRHAAHPRHRPLTIQQILAWADVHHARTGKWPTRKSGRVRGAQAETWHAIDGALNKCQRGLQRSSLAKLLARWRDRPNRKALPRLTTKQILKWAKSHYRRTGRWPSQHDGPVVGTRHERWYAINVALALGRRGLPGGTTLARLMQKTSNVRDANKKTRRYSH